MNYIDRPALMYNHTPSLPTPRPFRLEGRLGRLSFIAWTVFFHILMSIVGVLGQISLGILQLSFTDLAILETSSFISLHTIFMVLFSIAYFYGILLITVRRLHDTEHSGWWTLCSFIPVVNLLLFFYLILRSGSVSTNAYGTVRHTPTLEKITAWIVIACVVISFGWFWTIIQWIMSHATLDLPQEMMQRSTEYF